MRAGAHWLAAVCIVSLLLGGCVPVPYRPGAGVSHVPVAAEDAAVTLLSVDAENGVTHRLAKSIHHEEPRIEFVDPEAFLSGLRPAEPLTLAELAAACRESYESPPADYVLTVAEPSHLQLHDTGAWAPFLFFPSVVGYEKTQSRETLTGTLLDLRNPASFDGLSSVSSYTEVTAGLFYGISTIAMPVEAVQRALAREIAHTLGRAHPQGVVRVVMLRQEDNLRAGDSEAARIDAGARAPEARR